MSNETQQPDKIAINSAASVNNTLVKAGKCSLRTLACSNAGGAAAFVKLYDKATAPVAGTDTPVLTIPVPTSGIVTLPPGADGFPFALGLGIAITNLVADADTTIVAANQVKVFGSVAG